MTAQTLVIMCKDPRPGRVKTRLAADIGTLAAALWVRRQIAGMAHELTHPHWDIVFAVAPDRAIASSLLPLVPRLPQGGGDLGDRMIRAFRSANRGPVLIVGTDIPDLTRKHVWRGFDLIARHKAVIGPATDGGFWAIGLDTRRPIPANLFAGVRWSTEHALSDTLATCPKPALLPVLADVDTAEDLARLSD